MTARIGGPKTGGRQRGSIDREQRKVLTDKMSADLMWCYGKLGGRTWLLEFAKAQPAEFIRQGLSRLWPAPQRDDPPDVVNNTINVNTMSELESARRVAFALAKAIYPDPSLAPVDVTQLREPVAEVVPRQAERERDERRRELL